MSNGNDGFTGFDFTGFFDGLLQTLADFIAAILGFLVALVQAIVNALNYLLNVSAAIFGFSFLGIESLGQLLHSIFTFILRNIILVLLKHLWSLVQKIQAFVAKLKAWLTRFHLLQNTALLQAMRRVVNLIQRIRQILVLFRIFHLKFATKLDNWLASLEGLILRRVFDHVRKTNEIIGWLNVILDPVGSLRTMPHLASLGKTGREVIAYLTSIGFTHLIPQFQQVTGPGVPARPWSDVIHQFTAERSDSSGDYGAVVRQGAQFRELLKRGLSTS